MKETKLSNEQLEVIASNNNLARYLSGLSQGKKATPRSSLYNLDGKTELLEPDEILQRWKSHLTSLESMDSYCKEVFRFDSHQLEKWGPQGEVAPIKELLKDIVYPTFSGSDEVPKAFSTQEWANAKRRVVRYLHNAGCIGLSPVPYHRVVDDMRARDTLESNSGWPLYTRRNQPEVVKQSIEEAENGRWKTYPAIALFRNYNRKTRLVWMFPMSANLVEGSFFQALEKRLLTTKWLPARQFLAPWSGFEGVRDLITDKYSYYHGGKRNDKFYLAASDFSSTDAHFQLRTSLEVFDVLKECFQPRYRNVLLESIEYMHSIPLVVSETTMLTGMHGVSSGSNWTNFIETIFDWILSEYVSLVTSKPQHFGLYAIGDDMTWYSLSYQKNFNDELSAIGESVGQVIKAEKTTNDPDKVVSLQRLFQRGYVRPDGKIRAVYPTIRALKSLVYPERFHKPKLWSKDMEVIRAFMILENCVDHPLFHDFCKFVAAGDPYMVEFAKKSPAYQQKQFMQSKLVHGLNPTYNQEKRDSSLVSFESIKFVATL